jgi:hypothetical protein
MYNGFKQQIWQKNSKTPGDYDQRLKAISIGNVNDVSAYDTRFRGAIVLCSPIFYSMWYYDNAFFQGFPAIQLKPSGSPS